MKAILLFVLMTSTQVFAQNPLQPQDISLDPSFQKMLNAGESIFLYLQPYNYDSESRRDPFKIFRPQNEVVEVEATQTVPGAGEIILTLQQYPLARLKLVGVMWNVQDPKVLIKDPTGKVHVLERNDRLGERSGYVAAIRESEMVVVQSSLGNDGQTKYEAKVITLK